MASLVRVLHTTIAFCFCATVALTPFPLGSNRDWAWSPLGVVTGMLLLMHVVYLLVSGRPSVMTWSALGFPTVALGVVLLWSVVQTLELPYLSMPNPILESAGKVLGGGSRVRITLDDERTRTAIMRLMSYCGIFLLSAELAKDRAFCRRLCATVIGSAVVVTLYGWVMQVTAQSCVAWTYIKRPIEDGPCSFSGTFINSDNYATYVGLATLVCLAQLHALLLDNNARTGPARERWRIYLMTMSGKGSLLLGALLILLGGAIYSGSKAGLVSLVFAAIIMNTTLNFLQRGSRATIVWSAISILVLMAFVLAIGGETVISRAIAFLSEGDRDRVALYSMTLNGIALRPWTGWGLGTFASAYSILQPPQLEPFYDKAHNVYLEILMTLGIPCACLFFAALAFIVMRCLKGMALRSRDSHYPALGFGATMLVGLHSSVDFGVQIPAVAVLYTTLLGLGWSQSWVSKR